MLSRGWVLVTLLAASLGAAPVRAADGDGLYARPGRLVDVGGRRLNLYCIGSGTPAVIFDAGWEDWSPSWARIQPGVGTYTQACAYDRAGAGFSDPGPLPRTSARIAADLRLLLRRAGVRGPVVLVGHSFGGFNARTFVDRFNGEVAGLVLVDGSDQDLPPVDPEPEADGMQAYLPRHFREIREALLACGRAVAAHAPLPPAVEFGGGGEPCPQQFFRGLPESQFSDELNAGLAALVLASDHQYVASASEVGNFDPDGATIRRLRTGRRLLGARPVRVLTALNRYGDDATTPADRHSAHAAEEDRHRRTQAGFLVLSTDAEQWLSPDSGHYIQFDDPGLVLRAIRDVVESSRKALKRPPAGNRAH